MSQNRPDNETNDTTLGTGGAGTGATDLGTTRDTSGGTVGTGAMGGGLSTTGGGAAAGTARGLSDQAKEYGQKVADAASSAKDYLSDRASVVGEKIQDLRNADYQELAENAKQYARQNPGQALLVAAATGFVLGLLLRGGRR